MYDGDLSLVLNNETMMKGVDRNASIVIDVEDKVTALKEEYNMQNRTNCIIRSLRSSIGEISNYASAYHNKAPRTDEQKARYESYVDLLSVVNGKFLPLQNRVNALPAVSSSGRLTVKLSWVGDNTVPSLARGRYKD